MMTYLSQYPNAKLKTGAPLRPKTNPSRVRAYGPGKEYQHYIIIIVVNISLLNKFYLVRMPAPVLYQSGIVVHREYFSTDRLILST